MALHPKFPSDPHAVLDPAVRWFPADEAYRDKRADQLMPPLVSALRKQVQQWRDRGYQDATTTSKSLLTWWFGTQHLLQTPAATASGSPFEEFQYFFAQREALETIVYLYDVFGTNAFMEFVESIQAEGVVLERQPMGEGTGPKTPLVVEVDRENANKDTEALDIEIPVLSARVYREYKDDDAPSPLAPG